MTVVLVGNDWAEDHHDVELMDETGRTLARARLSEGAAGMARLHALIGEHAGAGEEEVLVRVGIAVNPLQAARYRERHAVSGAKSDPLMPAMRTCWPTWSAPMLTSCARSRRTASRRRRSRSWPARTRH